MPIESEVITQAGHRLLREVEQMRVESGVIAQAGHLDMTDS